MRDTSRDDEIRRRLEAGETLEQIAVSFGVTRERIRQIAKAAGVVWARRADVAHDRWQRQKEAKRQAVDARRQARTAFREERLAEARALVEGGMSIAKAFTAVGWGRGHHRLGKGWPTTKGRWRQEVLERCVKIIPFYQSGIPAWCIAEMLGMSCEQVKVFLRRRGIELRPERKPILPKWKPPAPPKPAKMGGARKARSPRQVPLVPHNPISAKPSAHGCAKWTEDHLALLADRWNANISASVIADELGPPFTRNAVIGQVFRQRRRAAANEARAA